MNWRAPVAIAAALMLGVTARPHAGGDPWSDAEIAALRERLDTALAIPALRGAHVGLLALDTARGTALYARHADDEFAPASNFKLLVGSAALRDLGVDFRFITTLLADAAPREGVVSGNLYLRGGGDAHLSAADLRAAATAATSAGVRHIDGALITDASHDDAQRYAPGWSWDDLPYEYAAVVSALELDEGVVHVYVSPGSAAGAPTRLRVEPSSRAFTIENLSVTGAAHSEDTTDVARPWYAPQTIEITGSYPTGAPESDDLEPSVPNPEAYAGDLLLRELASLSIIVAGGVRDGATPAGAATLWRHQSAQMPELLSDFWLPSDNLMGELFLKELGAAQAGEPGTYANGIAAERKYLGSIGVDPSTVSIFDGSGLSVYDRITPRDLVAILQSDWNGAQRDVVVDALPEAGVRGTLKDSFAGTRLTGSVFAKTGTARHTRALSGFVQTDDHGPVTFSLLINGWLGDDQDGGEERLDRGEAALLEAVSGSIAQKRAQGPGTIGSRRHGRNAKPAAGRG